MLFKFIKNMYLDAFELYDIYYLVLYVIDMASIVKIILIIV